ncbi:3-hydroxyacyl-CoA dehydrogenase family protein [Cellulomonas sp. KRMCY2]|uniref:3-hydroxyacyl-CoA dehydrogenase family protein n=1 Tax=Cellulomonas sp. KRMCY2 TaxID=1304865 RepID=UPI00045EA358|nr:3-hydroxyacyl-CoA dehydrogenase NAD-binding domain-containing protein [Cellulomonas sp. KRMCY2]
MTISAIGIVGAGTMGSGIAQVAAQSGLDVVLCDIEQRLVESAVRRIDAHLERAVVKEKLTADDKQAALARITTSTDLGALSAAQVVIEAVIEDLELKKSVFTEVASVCPEDTVLATNTSSMSVTELGAASGRPDRFCGIHFFNPVPVMRLVEVIRGVSTSDATVAVADELVERLGKTVVHVAKDSPGFIVNRLLVPFLNEAARLLSEGVASIEDIDTAVKLGLNHPMGPFELIDMGGADLTVTVLDYFQAELGSDRYAPQPVLRRMARAGLNGRKSGAGFYQY